MVKVTLQQQIEMAIAYSGSVTKKEIAEKMNVTPSAFGQRLKTGKFTKEELLFWMRNIFQYSDLKMVKKYSRTRSGSVKKYIAA